MLTSSFPAFSPLAGQAASAFVACLWQGSVLVAAVALCLKTAKSASSRLRFAVWAATFCALAALPLLPLAHTTFPAQAAAVSQHPLLLLDSRWSLAIALLWISISLYRLADLAWHAWRLRALWNSAPRLDHSHLASGIASDIEICATHHLANPGVIGFFAPKILLPLDLLERLTPDELRQVLLHEAEHLRRRDDWTNLLQKLCLTLFPLHLPLLWVERQLCRERELACDEGVVHQTHAPRAYAICLTRLAEQRLDAPREALALGAWRRRSELVHRVHALLARRTALPVWQTRLLCGLILAGIALGAAAFARAPELVAFTAPAATAVSSAQPAAQGLQSAAFRHSSVPRLQMASFARKFTPRSTNRPSPRPAQTVHQLLASQRTTQVNQTAVNSSDTPEISGWLVLTDWPQGDASQPARRTSKAASASASRSTSPVLNLVFTLETPDHQKFAAVPTRSGWLVIQL
jgi:beta-lactamase regulating signal transducer with metallopeptidase domain